MLRKIKDPDKRMEAMWKQIEQAIDSLEDGAEEGDELIGCVASFVVRKKTDEKMTEKEFLENFHSSTKVSMAVNVSTDGMLHFTNSFLNRFEEEIAIAYLGQDVKLLGVNSQAKTKVIGEEKRDVDVYDGFRKMIDKAREINLLDHKEGKEESMSDEDFDAMFERPGKTLEGLLNEAKEKLNLGDDKTPKKKESLEDFLKRLKDKKKGK